MESIAFKGREISPCCIGFQSSLQNNLMSRPTGLALNHQRGLEGPQVAEVRVRAVGPVLGSIGENNGGSTRIGVTSESEGASTTALALALSPAPPPMAPAAWGV